MEVNTPPKSGAECKLANEKGSWTVPKTPGSTTVTKAYGDLTVSCAHPDGSKGSSSVQSSTAGAAFGNIIAGGIIGAAVDMGSGAAYIYPSSVSVAMTLPEPPAAPAPEPVALQPARLAKDEAERMLRDLADLKAKKLINEADYRERSQVILAKMWLRRGWACRSAANPTCCAVAGSVSSEQAGHQSHGNSRGRAERRTQQTKASQNSESHRDNAACFRGDEKAAMDRLRLTAGLQAVTA